MALTSALAVASARAQPSDAAICEGPVVRASAELEQKWAQALAELRAQLSRQSDIDRCAQVQLRDNGGRVLVTVLLHDGRLAARSVSTPEAAIASVEALLTVLPGLELFDTSPRPDEIAAKQVEPAPKPPPEEVDTDVRPPDKPARVIEVDVGFGATARVAGRPWFVGYGLTAHAGVAINQWLIGGWTRWLVRDHLLQGTPPPGLIVSSFLVGAFAGRRFVLGNVALDFVVGPNLVVDTEEAAASPTEAGGENASLALNSTLRLLVPRHGSPGFFAAFLAEVSPNRVSHAQRADPSLPVLPPWGLSLALGVFWGGL